MGSNSPEYMREYRAANKEKLAAYDKAYREANKEKVAERRRAYREANKEKIAEKNRAYGPGYYQANREKILERQRARHAENPDIARAKDARRRAREREAFVEDVTRSQTYARTGGQCHLCLRPIDFDEGWHQDHVIPLVYGGVHAYDNLAPAHAACNLSKKDDLTRLSVIPWIENMAIDAMIRMENQ
jgi:5-methylcytosine-specific restriction endonuclease McrA